MITRVGAAALVGAGVFGLGVTGEAQAATFVAETISNSFTAQTAGPNDNQKASSSTDPVAVTSGSVAEQLNAKGASSGYAAASRGAVRSISVATGETSASVCCTSGSSSSRASAEYEDSFVLLSPGVAAGTVGTVLADVLLSGTAGGVATGELWGGSAFWRAKITVNDQSVSFSYSANGNYVFGIAESGDPFGLRNLAFGVRFGEANQVSLEVETFAEAGAGGVGFSQSVFTSNLGSTLSWEGFDSVTVGGLSITDFTAVSSETGFDFEQGFGAASSGAVPEPGAWAIMIVGFGFVGASLRRRSLLTL